MVKGIVLAGGRATRLYPLTKITSKQLLPVYDRPMIYYPIETLLRAGITEILVIVAPEYAGHFLNLLGSGREFGARFSYEVQDEPRGLADAFLVGEHFVGSSNVALILGDNIFDHDFRDDVASFAGGAHIFAREVPDPARYGVVELSPEGKVLSIEEKPHHPRSSYAIPGFYIFDNRVVDFARQVKPSARGELEIVEIHKTYLRLGELQVSVIEGLWEDAGTFDSLLRAGNYMAEKARAGSPDSTV